MSLYIPVDLVREVRKRAREICEYRLLPQQSQEATFHIDKILPQQAGGLTEASSLAFACVTCALRKAAKSQTWIPSLVYQPCYLILATSKSRKFVKPNE